MAPSSPQIDPRRLLVVMPTWLGDCVMATPTLRALRRRFPEAHITALSRQNVHPVLAGLESVDRLMSMEGGASKPPAAGRVSPGGEGEGEGTRPRTHFFAIARRLRKENFDAAVLLPNSFRAAAIVSMAWIPRRIGYDRDGRGFLLTDRLIPPRRAGEFVPVPALTYYLGIARYLGAANPDPAMELTTDPGADREAAALLARAGCDVARGDRLLLLNPGAQKREKRWAPDRFAALADRLAKAHHLGVAVTGSPAERDVLASVIAAAATPVIDLPATGVGLGLLKSVVGHSRLLVTNDTGPRHIAAALGTPVVSLFGPTTPRWTRIGFDRERMVTDPAGREGGDGGTMAGITVDAVAAAAERLLLDDPAAHASPAPPDTSPAAHCAAASPAPGASGNG